MESKDFCYFADISEHEPQSLTPKKLTKRYGVCMELMTTERNYLNILKAIQKVFHEPLIPKVDHLDATELKIIFGNVPPLIEVHSLICQELEALIDINWNENNEIGKVFLRHVSFLQFFIESNDSFSQNRVNSYLKHTLLL